MYWKKFVLGRLSGFGRSGIACVLEKVCFGQAFGFWPFWDCLCIGKSLFWAGFRVLGVLGLPVYQSVFKYQLLDIIEISHISIQIMRQKEENGETKGLGNFPVSFLFFLFLLLGLLLLGFRRKLPARGRRRKGVFGSFLQ